MKHIWQQAILIGATTAIVSSLNSPAQALTWSGTGVITSGSGQGGTVTLSLNINGNNVKFHSGPSQYEELLSINNGVVKSSAGIWYFQRCDRDLCINFEQYNPSRTIYYRLSS